MTNHESRTCRECRECESLIIGDGYDHALGSVHFYCDVEEETRDIEATACPAFERKEMAT